MPYAATTRITHRENIRTGKNLEVDGTANLAVVEIAGAALGAPPGTAITQTYSTAAAVNPDATYSAPSQSANTLVLTATNIASKTASLTLGQSSATNPTDTEFDQAMKDLGTAINTLNTNVAAIVTQLAALAADHLATKKLLNQVIDDLQAMGIET